MFHFLEDRDKLVGGDSCNSQKAPRELYFFP